MEGYDSLFLVCVSWACTHSVVNPSTQAHVVPYDIDS